MPVYNNLQIMLRDMEGFVRSTGRQLLPADDPRQRMVGYITANDPMVWWQIPLIMVRMQLGEMPRLLQGAFRTGRGRAAMLAGIHNNATIGLAPIESLPAPIESLPGPVENVAEEQAGPNQLTIFDRLLQEDT